MTSAEIKALRKRLGMSQAEFSKAYCIQLPTLLHWEHGIRAPQGPARVLLFLIDKIPDVVKKALEGFRWAA